MSARQRFVYLGLAVLCAGAVWLSIEVGTYGVDFVTTWRELALPRLLMSVLAGASLAMAGAMFQALFRNPLASPYTLGVSSGASLGASIVIMFMTFGGGLWYGVPVITIAAFVGALTCVSIVYAVASISRSHNIGTLLLAGITIGLVCSALIVVVLFLADKHDLTIIVRWMMGSLQIVGFDPVYESLAVFALACGVAIWLHRDLDLLMMGEMVAASRGVSVRRARRLIYFSASLLTAGIVAHCGPIGFVGLIIPHIARFLVGPSHRHLLPACALAGAGFLTLCDTLARNALWWLRDDLSWLQSESRQVPIGVLTNLIGGAFFLYLLCAQRRRRPLI
jgi:iron complex transport system permease protein